MISRRSLLAGIGTLPFVAKAAAAQDAAWQKTLDLARKEGKVVVYNSAIGAKNYLEVANSFEKKYGIKVETLDVRASELRERVRTEQAAGRFLGDLEQHGAATMFRQEEEGVFQKHNGIPNLKALRPEVSADGARIPAYIQAYGILINTNMVKPQEEPKTWADLTDPKWQGKILSDDMRALGGGQVLFFVAQQKFGQTWNEKLAANKPVFSRDLVNDTRRVARGEFPIYIPLRLTDFPAISSLPVKFILPPEGLPYVRIDQALLKNAPHPNAGHVFMNHFLDPEAQLTYANAGQVPAITGVGEKADPLVRPIATAKLLGTTSPELQDAMMAAAKQIYK